MIGSFNARMRSVQRPAWNYAGNPPPRLLSFSTSTALGYDDNADVATLIGYYPAA